MGGAAAALPPPPTAAAVPQVAGAAARDCPAAGNGACQDNMAMAAASEDVVMVGEVGAGSQQHRARGARPTPLSPSQRRVRPRFLSTATPHPRSSQHTGGGPHSNNENQSQWLQSQHEPQPTPQWASQRLSQLAAAAVHGDIGAPAATPFPARLPRLPLRDLNGNGSTKTQSPQNHIPAVFRPSLRQDNTQHSWCFVPLINDIVGLTTSSDYCPRPAPRHDWRGALDRVRGGL